MVAALLYLDAAYSYAFYDPSRGDLTLDSIELRDKLDELIPGRETTDRKRVYEDLLVMLPRFENELRIHQQEIRDVPEPLESGTPKVEEAIDAGERRFAGTTVPTLAIFAFPHDFGSAFKNNPIAQAAAEKADQSWTGAQIKFIESKYPSIRLVSIPHASHFRATRKLRCHKLANVRLEPKNRPNARLTFHQSRGIIAKQNSRHSKSKVHQVCASFAVHDSGDSLEL